MSIWRVLISSDFQGSWCLLHRSVLSTVLWNATEVCVVSDNTATAYIQYLHSLQIPIRRNIIYTCFWENICDTEWLIFHSLYAIALVQRVLWWIMNRGYDLIWSLVDDDVINHLLSCRPVKLDMLITHRHWEQNDRPTGDFIKLSN